MDHASTEAAPGRPRTDFASDLTGGGTPPDPASGDFEAAYQGTPPWDIGRSQPAFLHLAQTGRLRGRVLDVGCGTGEHALLTGEHALLAASLGLEATGLDAAPTAIRRAQGKAHERQLAARFVVGDALELTAWGEQFDTVLDCGLFHGFADEERARFVDGLAAVVAPGATTTCCASASSSPATGGRAASAKRRSARASRRGGRWRRSSARRWR